MNRLLIITGVLLVMAGFMGSYLMRLGIGRLPGDFFISTCGWALYFPLGSALIMSLIITLALRFFRR